MQLVVWVQPGAARSEAAGVHGDALRLRVAAPAVEGRANEEARLLLAQLLGVPKAAVVLLRGASARRKWFAVQGLTAAAALARLQAHVNPS